MAQKVITTNGNAQIDTAQSVFGGASGLFDGTGDYLSLLDSIDFSPGTGAFTIDFRMRLKEITAFQTPFDMRTSDTNDVNSFSMGNAWVTSSGYPYLYGIGYAVSHADFSSKFSTNTWYHIAIVGNGAADGSRNIKAYVDGVLKATITGNYDLNKNRLRIASNWNGGSGTNGWIDEFRFSKGIQRWTTDFTPPVSAYETDSYTKLLLHCDGVDASTIFYDSSSGLTLGEYLGSGPATTKLLLHLNGDSGDFSGNGNNGVDTNITYVDGKFGQGAYNNGGGSVSKINIPSSASLISPSSAITISCWLKIPSYSNNQTPITMRILPDQTSPYNVYSFDFKNSYQFVLTTTSGTQVAEYSATPITNTWYNIIGTYDGSNMKLYLNSNLVATKSQTGNIDYVSSRELRIANNTPSLSQFFNGSIDEVIVENRAWSAEEVKKYYTYSQGRFGII